MSNTNTEIYKTSKIINTRKDYLEIYKDYLEIHKDSNLDDFNEIWTNLPNLLIQSSKNSNNWINDLDIDIDYYNKLYIKKIHRDFLYYKNITNKVNSTYGSLFHMLSRFGFSSKDLNNYIILLDRRLCALHPVLKTIKFGKYVDILTYPKMTTSDGEEYFGINVSTIYNMLLINNVSHKCIQIDFKLIQSPIKDQSGNDIFLYYLFIDPNNIYIYDKNTKNAPNKFTRKIVSINVNNHVKGIDINVIYTQF